MGWGMGGTGGREEEEGRTVMSQGGVGESIVAWIRSNSSNGCSMVVRNI